VSWTPSGKGLNRRDGVPRPSGLSTPINPRFLDYKIPSILEVPEDFHVELMPVADEVGPVRPSKPEPGIWRGKSRFPRTLKMRLRGL
jgi:hypothetical protein